MVNLSISNNSRLDFLRQDVIRMSSLASRQMEAALDAFERQDAALASSIIDQDDLMDNLNLKVEAGAFEAAAKEDLSPAGTRAAISLLKVAVNLERIGDAATHIAKRIRLIQADGVNPIPYPLHPYHDLVIKAIQESVRAYLEEDLLLAKNACELEPALDEVYVDGLKYITRTVNDNPESIYFYLHLSAVLKHLEKVGDYVLNIGEQAIYLITGRRLQFSQFQQLDYLLQDSESNGNYFPYHDGVSGATVARVGEDSHLVFKDGGEKKIRGEIRNTQAWEEIGEGLVPKVVSTVSYKDRTALLREFVDGALLSQIFFEDGDLQLKLSLTRSVCNLLEDLWRKTAKEEPPRVDYMDQIRQRLPDVFNIHPPFRQMSETPFRHKGKVIPPLSEQLAALELVEKTLAPPHSFWLHGDFNPNNMVYNSTDSSLKFIDIHRSRYGDYLQDLTVFIVGLERSPDLSPTVRRQMGRVKGVVQDFASNIAGSYSDHTWEKRMKLGLGRSYLTSARIILHSGRAEWLLKQGRICLQEALDIA